MLLNVKCRPTPVLREQDMTTYWFKSRNFQTHIISTVNIPSSSPLSLSLTRVTDTSLQLPKPTPAP